MYGVRSIAKLIPNSYFCTGSAKSWLMEEPTFCSYMHNIHINIVKKIISFTYMSQNIKYLNHALHSCKCIFLLGLVRKHTYVTSRMKL